MYRNGKNGIQSVAQLEYGEVALSVAGDLSFQSEKGSIELIKMDQNKDRVAGVVFELKDSTGKVVGQNTSDSNGVVRFAKLEAGTYTLVEKSAPNGYIMGTKPFSATVKTGEVFRLEVVNTKVQGKLQIVKTDDEKAPLSGVTFQILDSNKKVVDEITTDSKGLATSKYLAKGSYTYREIKVPNGIILDSAEYPFEISTNNQVVTKNIVNNRKRGGLKIVKVDDANMPLSGVTFQILDSNKKVIETVVTDKQGLATTKQLVNGTYYYRETKVPAGVIIDTNVYEFKISESNLVTKKIVNQKEKGNLKIVKVDDTAKALAGVKFEILNGKKEVVDTVTTNAQGIATTKYLPVGTYYYKEVAVPAGIVLDTQEHAFTLKASTTVTKTVVNQRVKGGLKITKVDDSNKTIANVKFEIKDAAGNVVDTITTNAQGIATSKTLTMGKYTYKEIYAPAGYIMDTKEYSFEVTETNKAIEKTVVNKLSKGGLKIIKVDDSENPIAGVKFEILDENKKVIGTLVTDANGVTNSQELEIGTYYFREVSAPAGVVVDKTEHKFVVEKDGQVVIRKVINSVVKGKLKIVKVDDQDQPIANVKFIIKNAQGEVVETLITDKDGLAVSKILSYGKYTAKEVSAPAGYIVDGKEFEFNITENNKILVKKVVNSRAKGVLQIIKTDDSKKVLEGVTFEILDSEKEVVTTVTTDENGRASVADLTVGKYYYREIKVPENIVLDSTLYSFEMSGNTVTKNIENKIIKGNLKVIKTDDVMKKPLANVKFEIYYENKD